MPGFTVRPETAADRAGIRATVGAAFETDAEARLVDALREHGDAMISLVAVRDDAVLGHVLLSVARVGGVPVLALAPVAVTPEYQRRGIGRALIDAALERARAMGFGAVVVLGHPSYYPRFGFVPAGPHGIECPYDAPADAFMVLELSPGALGQLSGPVVYAPAFAALG